MSILKKIVSIVALVAWSLTLTACAGVSSSSPKDIRVISVTDVDYKDQAQLEWVDLKPRPSLTISRIDFTTQTDLLALAKKNDYHVTVVLGPCTKKGVKDNGAAFGGVYWGRLSIAPDTKDDPDYKAAVAKGPPFTYQAYVKKNRSSDAQGVVCLALAGGSMLGGKFRSNDAIVPIK